jgi:hypothetical protein
MFWKPRQMKNQSQLCLVIAHLQATGAWEEKL